MRWGRNLSAAGRLGSAMERRPRNPEVHPPTGGSGGSLGAVDRQRDRRRGPWVWVAWSLALHGAFWTLGSALSSEARPAARPRPDLPEAALEFIVLGRSSTEREGTESRGVALELETQHEPQVEPVHPPVRAPELSNDRYRTQDREGADRREAEPGGREPRASDDASLSSTREARVEPTPSSEVRAVTEDDEGEGTASPEPRREPGREGAEGSSADAGALVAFDRGALRAAARNFDDDGAAAVETPGPALEGPSPAGWEDARRPKDRVVDDPGRALVPLADGSWGYGDPDGQFNALIQPDGSVLLQDSASTRTKLCVAFVCLDAGQVRELKAGRPPPRRRIGLSFAPVPLGLSMGWGAKAGTTRAESNFLRRTFDLRLQMRSRWERRQFAQQLSWLRRELDALWTRPELDGSADGDGHGRRRTIYQAHWEDCAPEPTLDNTPGFGPSDAELGTSAALHAARREAALAARRLIERHWNERTGEPLFGAPRGGATTP